MAVPKKRTSHFKATRRYTTNNTILFKPRKFNYSVIDIVSILTDKDNWITKYFLKQKKRKDRL